MSDPLLAARRRRTAELLRGGLTSVPALVGVAIAIVAALLTHWAVAAVGAALIVAIAYARASKRAGEEWWEQLAQTLGMRVGVPELGPVTPLVRSGDEREVHAVAEDDERRLVRFTTTDVSTDSEGRRSESDHHYTLVVYADPAPPRPLRFLSAHERKLMGLMDDRRGRMPRNVDDHDLESQALNKRFTVRISNEDAPRLGELFEPSFMLWMAEHGHPFEQELGVLVIYEDRHLKTVAEHRALLDDAARIRARIRDAEGAPLPRD